ncbi:MAG: hypothetical protein RI932_1833, partial [Pseudomonadota bacterium]
MLPWPDANSGLRRACRVSISLFAWQLAGRAEVYSFDGEFYVRERVVRKK